MHYLIQKQKKKYYEKAQKYRKNTKNFMKMPNQIMDKTWQPHVLCTPTLVLLIHHNFGLNHSFTYSFIIIKIINVHQYL